MPAERGRVARGLSEFRRRHALREYRMVRGLMRKLGYDAVPANFYSPIPALSQIPESVWTEPTAMPGVKWDLDAQLQYLEGELAPLIAEFDPPLDPPGGETGFYLRNGYFQVVDAEVLYAMVRRFRPATVVELGAGFSTLVIEAAAQRNRADGSPLRHEVHDPFPSPILEAVRDRIELHAHSATEVDPERLAELLPGDLLFIDTTHTVKPDSDVVHLILGALPLVSSGVVTHIHDFYRPFEYPRLLMDVFGMYWQEHFVVQALLCLNPEFEILSANHALRRLRSDRIAALVPRLDQHAQPNSLWLRRTGPAHPPLTGAERQCAGPPATSVKT